MFVTLGFSAIVNYAIERPTRQIGRWLVKRLPKSASPDMKQLPANL
jgi:hypothetical protein